MQCNAADKQSPKVGETAPDYSHTQQRCLGQTLSRAFQVSWADAEERPKANTATRKTRTTRLAPKHRDLSNRPDSVTAGLD
jgi:hypothetical protein